jgi:hypothetical protein
VYHFLVPDEGMAPYESDRSSLRLCPKEIAALKAWRKAICLPFTPHGGDQAAVDLHDHR